MNIIYEVGIVGPTQALYLMVWLYCVVLMSDMVGVKNKWNDMVECGGIVAAIPYIYIYIYIYIWSSLSHTCSSTMYLSPQVVQD